jgi:hypothetical protein
MPGNEEERVKQVSERLDGGLLTDIWPSEVVEDGLTKALRVYELIQTKLHKQRTLEALRHGLHVTPREMVKHKRL